MRLTNVDHYYTIHLLLLAAVAVLVFTLSELLATCLEAIIEATLLASRLGKAKSSQPRPVVVEFSSAP